jgi:hypothetical protein
VDVTEGIQKQVTVLYCKDCGRYLQVPTPLPPAHLLREGPHFYTASAARVRVSTAAAEVETLPIARVYLTYVDTRAGGSWAR